MLKDLAALLHEGLFEYPTLEWVKEETHPAGTAGVVDRHLPGCSRFPRESPPSSELVGGPMWLATDAQMRNLAPCATCVTQAQQDAHPEEGWRSGPAPADEVAAKAGERAWLGGTDRQQTIVGRREQAALRQWLLRGRDSAECDLCGKELPTQFLVAAHIVPRSKLSNSERTNFKTAAFLACTLGCDALFESGHVVVGDDGRTLAGRPAEGSLADSVRPLLGRPVARHHVAADGFRRHRLTHTT